MEPEADTTKNSVHCLECQRLFPSSSALKKHMRVHSHDQKYQCKECNKKYATVSGLEMHMRMHNDDRRYKCDICCKTFMSRSVLMMHMRGHTGEKPYVCKECGKSYTQSATLAEHMNTKHNKGKRFKCAYCQMEFKHKHKFRKHLLAEHEAQKCEVCDKKFTTKRGLMNHKKLHVHETLLKCDMCDEQFKTKKNLTCHLRLHAPGEKLHEFKERKREYEEQQRARQERKRKLQQLGDKCEECGKFTDRIDKHMRSKHKRVRFMKYICNECGYRYHLKRCMVIHNKKCPMPKQKDYFKCDHCEENCKNYKGLASHAVKHLTLSHDPPPLEEDSYLINPCYYVKNFNESYEKHVPSGIRRYICNTRFKEVESYVYPNGNVSIKKIAVNDELRTDTYTKSSVNETKDLVILLVKKEIGPSTNQVMKANFWLSAEANSIIEHNNTHSGKDSKYPTHGLQLEIYFMKISHNNFPNWDKTVYDILSMRSMHSKQTKCEIRNQGPPGKNGKRKTCQGEKILSKMTKTKERETCESASDFDVTISNSSNNSISLRKGEIQPNDQCRQQEIENNENVNEQRSLSGTNTFKVSLSGASGSESNKLLSDTEADTPSKVAPLDTSMTDRQLMIQKMSQNIKEKQEISWEWEHSEDSMLDGPDHYSAVEQFGFLKNSTKMEADCTATQLRHQCADKSKDEKSIPPINIRMASILKHSLNIEESEEVSLKEETLNDELSSDLSTSTNNLMLPEMDASNAVCMTNNVLHVKQEYTAS